MTKVIEAGETTTDEISPSELLQEARGVRRNALAAAGIGFFGLVLDAEVAFIPQAPNHFFTPKETLVWSFLGAAAAVIGVAGSLEAMHQSRRIAAIEQVMLQHESALLLQQG